MNNILHSDGSDGSIDLRALLLQLWSRRWWLLLSVVICTSLTTAAAFMMTPVYRASVVLVPAGPESGIGGRSSMLSQLGGLASLAGINVGGGGSQTDEALTVLKSRDFTQRFIEARGLLPILFADKWDAGRKDWKVPAEKKPTLADAFRKFDKGIRTVAFDKKTNLVSLEIEWRDPQLAADWANDLAARLNDEMRGRAIANTNASVGFLTKELANTGTVETREAISRLLEAQLNQRMLANVNRDYALRIIDRALPPDSKDIVRPKKLQLIALGPAVGMLFGSILILLFCAPAGRETAARGQV